VTPRSALPWLLWFVAVFWLWLLLVGEWDRIELIAAACAAAVTATIAEPLRRSARVHLGVSVDVVRRSALVFPMVFVDFALLVAVLARSLAARSVVRGRYVRRSFDPGPKTTPRGAARRAWTVLLAGYSPNAYVVDVDVEGGTVLVHDLVPHRSSEEPA
jgi:hypothetical protein